MFSEAPIRTCRTSFGTGLSGVGIVDIGGTAQQLLSFALATAGNGQVLAADAADPDKFLATLEKALDLKNQKVCGQTY